MNDCCWGNFSLFSLPLYALFILFPVLFIHSLVRLIFYFKKQKTDLKNFGSFYLPFLTLPILVNIAWQELLYNKVYYYWDSLGIYYAFIGYETPGPWPGDWILPGWEMGLFLVWFFSSIFIFASTYIYSKWRLKNVKNNALYNKINIVTLLIFLAITFLFAISHFYFFNPIFF